MAIKVHYLPKKKINLSMNEYGDMYRDGLHLGELNLFNDDNAALVGPTGPTGPATRGLRGPRGDMGQRGMDGPTGPSTPGPLGCVGDDGPRGLVGTVGPRGREGDKGDVGPRGAKGGVRYAEPRYFLYARVNGTFKYDGGDFDVIPWYHISNHGFKVCNEKVSFPNKTGVYKIEVGVQVIPQHTWCTHSPDELESSCIQVQLSFTNKLLCKTSSCVVPYCSSKIMTLSNCETAHYIHVVDEPTDLYIHLNTHGAVQKFENMYLCITEII